MKYIYKIFIAIIAFFICNITPAQQIGELDPAFGSNGIVNEYFNGVDGYMNHIDTVSGGKILGIGKISKLTSGVSAGDFDDSFNGNGVLTELIDSKDAKFNVVKVDGSENIFAGGRVTATPDVSPGDLFTAFSGDGIVDGHFVNVHAELYASASTPDGKIVAVGRVYNSTFNYYEFLVMRFNEDGSMDNTFGNSGVVKVNLGTNNFWDHKATDVEIYSDGSILFGGTVYSQDVDENFMTLVKLEADGSFDNNFYDDGQGTYGYRIITFHSATKMEFGEFETDPDGKIIVVGTAENHSAYGKKVILVARLRGDGWNDNNFGNGGSGFISFPSVGYDYTEGYRISRLSNGSYAVFGKGFITGSSYPKGVIGRLTSGGDLENIGSTGAPLRLIQLQLNHVVIKDVYEAGNDEFFVAGGGSQNATYYPMVSKINKDGDRVTSFFSSGISGVRLLTAYNNSTIDIIKVQGDGKIVLIRNYGDMEIRRWNADGTDDASFGSSGTAVVQIGNSTDIARSIILHGGQYVVAGSYYNGSETDIALAKIYAQVNETNLFLISKFSSDGSLDNSFHNDGKQSFTFLSNDSKINDLEVLSNGKVIAGGTTIYSNSSYEKAILKFNADGTLDQSFNSSGYRFISYFGRELLKDVEVQDNGKILAVGTAIKNNGKAVMAIARLNENGSYDGSFGNSGRRTFFNTAYDESYGQRVVQLSNGQYLIFGHGSLVGGNGSFRTGIGRLNADGSFDTNLSPTGERVISINATDNYLADVYVPGDGNFYITGSVFNGTDYDSYLVCVDFNGSLVRSFGTNGKVFFDVGNDDNKAKSITADDAGNLVVTGNVSSSNDVFAARFNIDGTYDSSFGTNGIKIVDYGTSGDEVESIAISNGNYLLAGRNKASADPNEDAALARIHSLYPDENAALVQFNSDGSVDNTFGTSGKAEFAVDNNLDEGIIFRTRDTGEIIIAGNTVTQNGNQKIFVGEFSSDGVQRSDFGASNNGVQLIDLFNLNTVTDMYLHTNNFKIMIVGATTTNGGKEVMAAARLRGGGEYDAGFGNSGRRAFGSTNFEASKANRVLRLSNDEFILFGEVTDNGTRKSAIARLDTWGGIDGSLAPGGFEKVIEISTNENFITDAAPAGSDQFYIAGSVYNGSDYDSFIAKIDKDGNLIGSFGDDGIKTFDISNDDNQITNLVWDTQSKILLTAGNSSSTDNVFVALFKEDGSRVFGFASNGKKIVDFGSSQDKLTGLVSSNGSILIGGKTHDGSNLDLALAGISTAPQAIQPAGTGNSANDPILIENLGNLIWLSQHSEVWDKFIKQTANIDASFILRWDGGAGFIPIGNNSTKFTGTYDGDGYFIDDLFIDRDSESYVGLFGYIDGAVIKSLGLINTDITGKSFVGGLAGSFENGTIINCYSTGSISSSNSIPFNSYAGGLVGFNKRTTIENSFTEGSVSGGGNYIGGLVGFLYNGNTNNTFSISSASGGKYVGGFVGGVRGSTINDSYSTGSVSGSSELGGFAAFSLSTTINNSFWDTQTSGISSPGIGTGKTTSEMIDPDTFLNAGWDYATPIWRMSPYLNDGYPVLAWQKFYNIPITVESIPSTGVVIENAEIGFTPDTDQSVTLVFEEKNTPPSNVTEGGKALSKYWEIDEVSGGSVKVRLYFDPDSVANFEGNPTIYHYSGGSWHALSTTDVQTENGMTFIETTNYHDSFSPVTIGDEANPLPVELTYFEGTASEDSVSLKWETATEVNNYGFEVQKSEDRSQNSEWTKVGFVLGNGTTNSPHQYSFTDTSIPDTGRVYYRLKQIDNDGTFSYSKVVTIDLSTITSVEEEIPLEYSLSQNYPNPFNPTTTIKFGLPEQGLVDLRVYNILGEEVARLVNAELNAGYHEVSFGGNNLASGMYIYRISIGSEFSSIKKMLMIK